ncbi:ARM repeat-containing protein [Pholiota conissans]|uniref:ARM repeat-containing protein n=1 Tax=Pholiota conissans TaxID=109636 RepID=A0A9P5ZEY7_9AGAR|nr:ARM repeat-containing protein [Pholiota conissans]
MRRHNPMRVPDSHLPKGLASASESSKKTNEILPILQRMESADASERKWACVAVSNLIQNDPSTRRLLQGRNVVGALITRLTDSEEEVTVEAVGALRNLCIDGGYDICAEMYNKNILTPLKAFIPKISTTLSQFLGEPKGAAEGIRRIVYDFADNVITILWCLSETSNKALNVINEMRLVPFLMSFLAAKDKLPLSTVTSAAQSLYVLTDDNYPAITDVRTDASYLSILFSIAPQEAPQTPEVKADPRSTTLAVLAAGTLRNVSPIPPPSSASFVDIDKDVVLPLLQPVISSISLQETSNTVQELLQRQANEPSIENLSLKNTPKSDHKSTIEVELELLEAKLRTVQLALEILTGTCATLPDPEPDVPANQEIPEDEDLEFENEDATVDADMSMDEEPTAPGTSAPSFLTNLVAPLITLIQPTALSFPPLAAPSIHPPTTSALSAVHISALECLNNVFLSLTTSPNPSVSGDINAGVTVWNGVWSALSLVGTQTGLGQERRQEMWEVSTGVLWGIGRVWKGAIVPNNEQVNLLIQLCTASSNPRLQVKCIGALECLAQNPTAIEANQIISNYLISLLPRTGKTSPMDTEPMVQAASALIDIYSDEALPYDVNFRQGDYLSQLAASLNSIKTAVKAIDRRKEGGKELRRRGEEVYENLRDFIQYRKDLGL